jgi:hypothetical protein
MKMAMINRLASLSLAAFCASSGAALAAGVEEGFQPMFNGKDLTGWEGKPGWWRVEVGALTAESTKENPCDKCNYLMWRGGKPGDFEMRAEFRLFGAAANSGIQFRSKELPDWDTSGYQADMDGSGQWTGCLFEHTRGGVAMRGEKVEIDKQGKKKVSFIADGQQLPERADQAAVRSSATSHGAELLKRIKKDDWNSYQVIARGNQITLAINGVIMAQATDDQAGLAAREGVIALQMHPGPPMKVQFRNLRIKIFDPVKPK